MRYFVLRAPAHACAVNVCSRKWVCSSCVGRRAEQAGYDRHAPASQLPPRSLIIVRASTSVWCVFLSIVHPFLLCNLVANSVYLQSNGQTLRHEYTHKFPFSTSQLREWSDRHVQRLLQNPFSVVSVLYYIIIIVLLFTAPPTFPVLHWWTILPHTSSTFFHHYENISEWLPHVQMQNILFTARHLLCAESCFMHTAEYTNTSGRM